MKRLLIDGTNVAHIHFAANPARDINGTPAGIIKGMLGMAAHVNAVHKPQEILCFWDGPGGSLQRRKIYKGYKEGRKTRSLVGTQYQFSTPDQAEENYDWQTDYVRKLYEFCGINSIVTENYEADDGIAYIIRENPEDEHVIISCDKDFFQLVSEKNKVYNPISKREIDIESVLKDWEIHPSNWLFYRSISGDKSDNLDGVRGFGPKTLKKLFNLSRAEEIGTNVISEGISLLNEIEKEEKKLSPKEQRMLKNLNSLLENQELIDRNWKLMNLKEPLMPFASKRSIDFQIESFQSKFNDKDFYIEMKKLSLGINPLLPTNFVNLKK